MLKWKWALAATCVAALVLAVILLSCGDDDDDDAADDDEADDTASDDDTGTADDTGGDDDDDDTVSWEDRCEDFVQEFYEICDETLFDLSEDDATAGCINEMYGLPWECVMACWENAGDSCIQWAACIESDCDIPVPDDDTGDDSSDDTM